VSVLQDQPEPEEPAEAPDPDLEPPAVNTNWRALVSGYGGVIHEG